MPRTARNTSSSAPGTSELGADGKIPSRFWQKYKKNLFHSMIFYYRLSPRIFNPSYGPKLDLLREKMEEYKKNVAQAKPRQSLAWAVWARI